MSERIPQSVTRRQELKVFLSSDHISPATGKTVAVVISKNGGAFGNPSGGATNATEISNGWYYVDLTTTDTNTIGPLIVRGTAASCDDSEERLRVVDPHNAGFDGVPAVTAGGNGGLPIADAANGVKVSVGTGAGQINVASGKVPATMGSADYSGNTVQTGDSFGRLGAPAGASVSADIAAVKSDTGTILTDVNTGAGAIYTRIGAPAGASIAADIAAVAAHLPTRIGKNVALPGFEFFMVQSSDHVSAATGLTVTAQRSLDGAGFAGCANAVVEVGSGIYKIDLAAGDLNGNTVTLKFTASGADARMITIVTQP